MRLGTILSASIREMGPLQGAMLQSEEDYTRKLSVTFPAPVATALGLRLNSEAWLPYRTEISYLCQSVRTREIQSDLQAKVQTSN